MVFSEIMNVIKSKYGEVCEFAFDHYDEDELGLGEIEEVSQQGGMDEGSDWRKVLYFKDHDVYIEISGYYASHHGTDFDNGWDSCSEVKPVQKTITVYE